MYITMRNMRKYNYFYYKILKSCRSLSGGLVEFLKNRDSYKGER